MPALIATYTSAAGGAERLLLDVAHGLDEPPLIACPTGWLADEARARGFTVFELPARSLHVRRSRRDRVASVVRMAGHVRELRRLCQDVRPDLLVAWGMRTALAAAAATRRMDDPPRWIFQHIDFLPGPTIARAIRATAARADRIVCVSQAVARDLDPDGALSERIEVIHCGVDTKRFVPSAAADARHNEALMLGALIPWKRQDLALEIVAIAARELPDLRLRIAGKPLDSHGELLLARLRERAAQPDLAGRIEFSGPLADPTTALQKAGCLLHCSDREPFGLVLVEALASGTPVVATAAGGPAEIVDDSCGALYPPDDAAAGAAALARVLRDRDQLAAPARRRAETAFDLTAMQARYADLFRTAAQPSIRQSLAFVTVTYNSGPELGRLAASIARHAPGAGLIVVDNASSDDSRAVAEHAGATLIALDSNRGFGAAANIGVAAVDAPVTVIVNPDVELVDGSIAALAQQAQPGRLHAPLLLNPDGGRQDSAHPLPASPATALYSLLPGPALPRPLRRKAEPWRGEKPRRVGWATAACLVAQTDTLKRLGPFDESIFLYAEDLDLGLRAETWFHPEARVVHTRAHSTTREFGGENYELLARQRRDVVRRRLGARRAIVDDVIELMTFADRALLRRLAGRSAQRETERFRARVKAAVTR
ncbi:MAG: N-acetylglucosaminyl-diphospho-decaprenol L-rhamnosyltransferase [Thermoleophilaceae bacterium]|nr:N-acetylglucosaminyl-diphospho-decaprenol L-rhamnosyltransferase [Thermoleophilaceae bacterium]